MQAPVSNLSGPDPIAANLVRHDWYYAIPTWTSDPLAALFVKSHSRAPPRAPPRMTPDSARRRPARSRSVTRCARTQPWRTTPH
ncbi:hypothetical protein ACRDU6_00825 (plasmid) [Mycolicibacterium sp. ELW1]|uniref:hypothetical protein n=1 Tax=Mycobacteriaceae TaxID=1762 RepID=UPI00336A90FB